MYFTHLQIEKPGDNAALGIDWRSNRLPRHVPTLDCRERVNKKVRTWTIVESDRRIVWAQEPVGPTVSDKRAMKGSPPSSGRRAGAPAKAKASAAPKRGSAKTSVKSATKPPARKAPVAAKRVVKATKAAKPAKAKTKSKVVAKAV